MSKRMLRRTYCTVLIEVLEDRQMLSAVAVHRLHAKKPTATKVQSVAVMAPTYEVLASGGALGADSTAGATGYSPSEIRAAYGLNQVSFNGVTGDGTGQTIAIIDAYNDPTIRADLTAFDAAFGLSNPTFTVVNQNGGANLPGVDPAGKGNSNFEGEEALDVEWAHAMAPGASIELVEANDASPSNLFAAVNMARQQAEVSVVSMSFGGNETSTETQYDSDFTTPSGHQGVTFVASTGDSGEPGGYPAFSPNVVATGGTSLQIDSVGNYQSETGWTGSGGGVSQVESEPSYQTSLIGNAGGRATPDVGFDADPSTGVSVYDSYNNGTSKPWEVLGGTSVAAPAWAGILAVADQGRVAAGEGTLDSRTQALPLLYAAPAADFHDVTTGSNGFSARAGYDLVTGRGSPRANLLIPFLVSGSTTVTTPPPTNGPTIAGIVADNSTVTEGDPVMLTAEGVSDSASAVAVTFYEESNGMPGLQTGTGGDFAFTSVTDGSNAITLDTTGATGTFTFYAQVTDSAGGATATGASAPSVTVTVLAPNTNGPTVGSVSATPDPVVSGDVLTLTAGGVSDPTTSVRRVYFYEETNGVPGLQTGPGGDFGFRPVTAAGRYTEQLDTTGVSGSLEFYALAVDAAGNISAEGSSAPEVTVNIANDVVPDAPTGLAATAVSTTEVDLNWGETDSGQTGFTIQRASNAGFTDAVNLFTINRPDILSYQDTGLTPNTKYFYRVEAFNLAGDSGFSNVAPAQTPLPGVKLKVVQGLGNEAAGGAARPVVVEVLDAKGHVASGDGSAVTLSIAKGPAGGTIGGTATVNAVAGVATFGDLSLPVAGKYVLAASASGLVGANGKGFTVSASTSGAHLVVVSAPATAGVGKAVGPIVVELEDGFGNLITSKAGRAEVMVVSGPGTVKGGVTGFVKGRAVIRNLRVEEAGTYALVVKDSVLGVEVGVGLTVG